MGSFFILGLGKTGISLASFFSKHYMRKILAWDDDGATREKFSDDYRLRIMDPNLIKWDEVDKIFVSPGIPIDYPKSHNVIELAKMHNCEITSDVDFFLQSVLAEKVIAITGTNGKSTTTSMVNDVLLNQYKSTVAGNIGTPVLDLHPFDYDVFSLELSSFQLEICESHRFNVAILLDIRPDHLDRYSSFECYASTKAKIFRDIRTKAIVSVNTRINKEIFHELRNEIKIPISTTEMLHHGYSMIEDIIYRNGEAIAKISPNDVQHSENILASYVCGEVMGIDSNDIVRSIESFCSLNHRLEVVAHCKNITFINDSKATNTNSTERALSLYNNIYWIAGGMIKKSSAIDNFNMNNVKKAYFFGESSNVLFSLYKEKIPCALCENLQECILNSYEDAIARNSEQSNVVFSPAHQSFDEWENFEERGNFFKRSVLNILSSHY